MSSLIEPGTHYFINQTLKNCKIVKEEYYNNIFNIALFLSLLLLIIFLLIIRYKGKITPVEKKNKERVKQEYILSKIKNYQDAKQRHRQEIITNLPKWENNEYEIIHRKLYS
jgi:hypothetical protein